MLSQIVMSLIVQIGACGIAALIGAVIIGLATKLLFKFTPSYGIRYLSAFCGYIPLFAGRFLLAEFLGSYLTENNLPATAWLAPMNLTVVIWIVLQAAIYAVIIKGPKKSYIGLSRAFLISLLHFAVLAAAVPVVIFIAVLIGIYQIGGSAPAFADVVQPFLTARTASFKMTMKVEGVPTQTFDCLYAEPIHMRQINQERGTVVISDLQEGKIVTLMPAQHIAIIMELENMPEDQGKFNMFREIRKHLQEAQDTEDESVQFLGEAEIDGRTVIGYHVQTPVVDITVWADSQTKLPVEMTNTSGPTSYTMTDIVFDVELDESLFSLEIPEGYTIRTMQVDASEPREKDLIEMFRICVEHMDGNLPSVLDMNATMEFAKYQRKKMEEKGQEPPEESAMELRKAIMRMERGALFVQQLPAESDWHYTGKDTKFVDARTAIFWYRPEGTQTYRVIYGDLTVKNVAPENLPK